MTEVLLQCIVTDTCRITFAINITATVVNECLPRVLYNEDYINFNYKI